VTHLSEAATQSLGQISYCVGTSLLWHTHGLTVYKECLTAIKHDAIASLYHYQQSKSCPRNSMAFNEDITCLTAGAKTILTSRTLPEFKLTAGLRLLSFRRYNMHDKNGLKPHFRKPFSLFLPMLLLNTSSCCNLLLKLSSSFCKSRMPLDFSWMMSSNFSTYVSINDPGWST